MTLYCNNTRIKFLFTHLIKGIRRWLTVRDRSSKYKILCHSDHKLSKSQRASQSYQWFKIYGHFTEGVDQAYWGSCIGKGLRLQPAQQACFYYNSFIRVSAYRFFRVILYQGVCKQFLILLQCKQGVCIRLIKFYSVTRMFQQSYCTIQCQNGA